MQIVLAIHASVKNLVQLWRCSVLTSLILSGCGESAYMRATRHGTIDAWRDFIAQHPQDAHIAAAREQLAKLEIQRVQDIHTVIAYKRFLREFGDTQAARIASRQLEEMRFHMAMSKGTVQALRQFQRHHPQGVHRSAIEKRLENLEIQQALAGDDRKALSKAIQKHQRDSRVRAMQLKLDELDFAEARTAAHLFSYLADHPAGRHRDEVRTKLLSLKIEGLLVSGDLVAARALAGEMPLAKRLEDLKLRFERSEAIEALTSSRNDEVLSALPSHYLRSLDDLVKSLRALDPIERWSAVEELGFHVSIHAIDPLLDVFRDGRLPSIRLRAFESLRSVLRALPQRVADYEVAIRLKHLKTRATDAKLQLVIAVLYELTGDLACAASEYRRAWDANAPDPLLLLRWVDIRLERREFFLGAVVARQLVLWVENSLKNKDIQNALATSRMLCSSYEVIVRAEGALSRVMKETTEFPEDVEVFFIRAQKIRGFVKSRLRDAELKLLSSDRYASLCGNRHVSDRMAAGKEARLAAIAAFSKKQSPTFQLLRDVIIERDPDFDVRRAAQNSKL